MKQHVLIIFFILIFQASSMSQTCLPYGIEFTTQAEIDAFQYNYPGCSIIEGSVKINGADINNLNGLNVLSEIYGGLWIRSNDNLPGLQGLENLNTIGGYLRIVDNDSLTNLNGINNLYSVGDYLYISGNDKLESLEALLNLSYVGAALGIAYNNSLQSLSGLDNIEPSSFTDLDIYMNNLLTDCEVQSICSYLQSPNGVVSIYDNASGCNNPAEVASSCGFVLECLPNGNYYMFSQNEIDNFNNNYPNCTELNGDLIVEGEDISSLAGLNSITSVGGNLVIGKKLSGAVNPLLTSTDGLGMLEIVHGSLVIAGNENLSDISGLTNLDSVGGNLEIMSNDDLGSLSGLGNLLHIAASIRIDGNEDLPNLTGLENITSIGGNLTMFDNGELSELTGLSNLEEIGGNLDLWYNDKLSNLSGLGKLEKIGGDLRISGSIAFTEFSGVDMLDSIGGSMVIEFNQNLNSFSGLNELSTLQGNLSIMNNNNLVSLSGLDNLSAGSVQNLSINNNPSLSNCAVSGICAYLSSPGGVVSIYHNAPGCDSPPEIANECGFALSCLPYGNYYILSQDDVDEFFIDYPDCFDLNGYVEISGENITELSGLNGINSIESLSINGNPSLVDLEGLGTLSSIRSFFYLGNWMGSNAIQSISGLEGLTEIGKTFQIVHNYNLLDFSGLENLESVGDLYIMENQSLESLDGLESLDSIHGHFNLKGTTVLDDITQLSNLSYIDGTINIKNNDALSSLSGLENIESDSIDLLFITDNASLSFCEVSSVCEYLDNPESFVRISDNAPGCNSEEEVVYLCTVGIPEDKNPGAVILYPNPASETIHIKTNLNTSIEEINIYNQLGQLVNYKTDGSNNINVSQLPKGLYIIELRTINAMIREKILVK